ncbi:MAG: polyphosphate polymerase domain-containing protein, partial [Saprospiraceae bacterium]|jgi:hypothetical protein|nr:polyphosphate polymerase domain-containing protein [Saprospiraceae bacterium]
MRSEFKYFVPNIRLPELRSAIKPFVHPDKFASKKPDHEYTVRSIYFDTKDFDMYNTKIDHLAHRLKVRLRGYDLGDENANVICEIKRKYEGPIVKNRAVLQYNIVQKIFNGVDLKTVLPVTDDALNIRKFFYQILSNSLQPVVNVIYEREAYESKIIDSDNGIRLSIDKNLRSVPYPGTHELFIERDIMTVNPDHFILEVKFNRYCPTWIKPILADFELVKGPASKYVMCVESQPIIKTSKQWDALIKCHSLPKFGNS